MFAGIPATSPDNRLLYSQINSRMYTKLTIVLLMMLFSVSNGVKANTDSNEDGKAGISFNHASWEEVLEVANKQNKLIFVDCYTSWCGPCKMMAKTTFTEIEVGAFFNQHFVNVKLDMEKEPGIALKKKFGVSAFPTLLFLDANQNIIHKSVGALNKEELLKFANEALDGSATLAGYHKKYGEMGVSDPHFVVDYLNKLEVAGEKKIIVEVVNAYFKDLNKEELLKQQNWNLLKKYVHNTSNLAFQYLLKNQESFIGAYGKKEVEDKVYFTFLRQGNQLCDKEENGSYTLNEERKQSFLNDLQENQVRDKEMIRAYSAISTSRTLGDWPAYVAAVSKYLHNGIIDKGAMSLYNYALPVNKAVKEKSLRNEAASWCDMGIKIDGLSEGYINAFKDLKKQLNTVGSDQ